MSLDDIAQFIAFCGATRETIFSVTAGVSAAMALVLLWLQKYALPEQSWAKFFGIAFSIMTLTYLLRSLFDFAGRMDWTLLSEFTKVIPVLGSAANNLCFFYASLLLLSFSARLQSILVRVAVVWAIAAIAVDCAVIFGLSGKLTVFQRFPDGILSFACLTVAGWSLFASTRARGGRWSPWFALLVGLFYGSINILYASVPLISANADWKLNGRLDNKIEEFVSNVHVNAFDKEWSYDAFVLAIALAMKFLLFVAVLVPMVQSLVMLHPTHFRKTMDKITNGQLEYLSVEGIVRAIAKSFRADLVELCMRIPGKEIQRIMWWRWSSDERTEEIIRKTRGADKSIVEMVLATGKTVYTSDITRDPEIRARYCVHEKNMMSVVTVPIRYHGAIIGALNIESKSKRAFTKTIRLQVQNLADFLAPAIEARRQLSALDQCSFKLPRLELRAAEWSGDEMLSHLVDIVHGVLTPLATGIDINVGFRSIWMARTDEICNLPQEWGDDITSPSKRLTKRVRAMVLESEDLKEVRSRKTHLAVHDYKLGDLVIVLPSKNEEEVDPDRPMLGSSYLLRRTVASLVSDAIFDAARVRLAGQLNDLQIELNSEISSTSAWFEKLEDHTKKVDLLWVVVKHPNEGLLGDRTAVELIEVLCPYAQGSNGEGEGKARKTIVYDTPSSRDALGAKHVVEVPLPEVGFLWLGVLRQGFGGELEYPSPWKNYLDNLAEAAGSSLFRISVKQEIDRLDHERINERAVTAVFTATSDLAHKVKGMIDGLVESAEALTDAVASGRLRGDSSYLGIIAGVKETAAEFKQVVTPFSDTTFFEEVRPCDIRDVVHKVKQIHEQQLEKYGITFSIQEDGIPKADLLVDVESQDLARVIANLVENAIHAVARKRKLNRRFAGGIEVTFCSQGDLVVCNVSDNGPGVKESIKDDILKPGVTTKPGSGGWGLPLTERLLSRYGAHVSLEDSGSRGAVFALKLPKPSRSDQ